MTRSEILEKIGKLQKLESNPNVAQIFKDDAKTKIAVLEAQMAALDNAEKVTDATPSVPQPKEAKQSEPKLKTSKPKAKKDADGLKLPGTQVIENYGDHKLMQVPVPMCGTRSTSRHIVKVIDTLYLKRYVNTTFNCRQVTTRVLVDRQIHHHAFIERHCIFSRM